MAVGGVVAVVVVMMVPMGSPVVAGSPPRRTVVVVPGSGAAAAARGLSTRTPFLRATSGMPRGRAGVGFAGASSSGVPRWVWSG